MLKINLKFRKQNTQLKKLIIIGVFDVFIGTLLILLCPHLSQYKSKRPNPARHNHLPIAAEAINNSKRNLPKAESTKETTFETPQVFNGFSENIPILMYHYIEKPTVTTTLKGLYLDPKIFEAQLQDLQKNGYGSLSMADVAEKLKNQEKLNNKTIVLTFDDGYEDFYTVAFPLLKKYNFKGTVFVIINRLDTKGYLTRVQVRELADSGLVEIGSHTFNHPDLRILKNKDAKFEIQASKQVLEQISGHPVLTFAYPFGYFKSDVVKDVSSAGYTSSVSVMPGSKQGEENIWELRRLRPGERTGAAFINWLAEWDKK